MYATYMNATYSFETAKNLGRDYVLRSKPAITAALALRLRGAAFRAFDRGDRQMTEFYLRKAREIAAEAQSQEAASA